MTPPAGNRVLVVGAGGLGSGVLPSLVTAPDPPRITLIENDTVSLPNLHRQVLYTRRDLGRPKAQCAARRLGLMHGDGRGLIDVIGEALTPGNAREICRGFDLIIDCSDNFASKFLASDVACVLRIPAVIAGAITTKGQIITVPAGGRPCYRCLAQVPPRPEDAEGCAQVGILGPVPIVLGSLEAIEGLRILGGQEPAFARSITHIDLSVPLARCIPFRRSAGCAACGDAPSIAFDYESYSIDSPAKWLWRRPSARQEAYSRQEVLEGVGLSGQARIAGSIVACGEIGAAASVALALLSAAGVGSFILDDSSEVSPGDAAAGLGFATGDIDSRRDEAAQRLVLRHNPSASVLQGTAGAGPAACRLTPERLERARTLAGIDLPPDLPASLIFSGAAAAVALLLDIVRGCGAGP